MSKFSKKRNETKNMSSNSIKEHRSYKYDVDFTNNWKKHGKHPFVSIILFFMILTGCKKNNDDYTANKVVEKVERKSNGFDSAIARVLLEDCISKFGIDNNGDYGDCYEKEKERWNIEIEKAYSDLIKIVKKEQPQNLAKIIESQKKWREYLEVERESISTYYQEYSGGRRSDLDIMLYFEGLYKNRLEQLYILKEYNIEQY